MGQGGGTRGHHRGDGPRQRVHGAGPGPVACLRRRRPCFPARPQLPPGRGEVGPGDDLVQNGRRHGRAPAPYRTAPSRHDLRPVFRLGKGVHLVAEIKATLPGLLKDQTAPYAWIACDTTTTRALMTYVRKELAFPRQRVNALGYWRTA